ncbi:hypothetical protein BUALT_Bualt06G0011000 [Buddleja alternifolia]|uniref:Uncharacterized protein n=1 Tax=Buddleja alternifolia TaxID=168488 RepID=A0AAV6XBB9_9LAMI|nr:hypothetical protein BUALT_Bualt06G0011000 [Buddleja alternifolia]
MASRAIPIPHNYCIRYINTRTDCITHRQRCFSGGRSGGSRWNWEKNVNPNRRSRFSEAYVTDDYDEEDEFGFRNASKQRIWWSDDLYGDDDEEDEGFGILEASIGFTWVFKVFRAFGWMIPAIIISLLLGTGPNTIVMALALPIAQSALSLAADTFWGRSNDIPRPKFKSKKRPFSGARGRARVRKEKEKETGTQTGKEAGNYKTWVDANNDSSENEKRKVRNFGGWDELDNQVRVDMGPRVKNEDEPGAQERVKISRRTKGDTPLVLRLLIAMFPFLGFWIKLF